MSVSPDTDLIQADPELSACPRCTYSHGFHVAFVRDGSSMRIELICPSCSARYRMKGLEINTI
ncbi:MAG: hypothetical protein ACLFUJ_01435 [Phycisphaerae bacterium]